MATGQLPDILSGGLLPPGVMHIGLTTPLGDAYIDPFAAAQDPETQRVLSALGIGVTLGIGPAPAPAPGAVSLTENLKVLGLVAGGLLLFMVLGKRRRT